MAIDRKRKEFKSINFDDLLFQYVDFNKLNHQLEWLLLEYFDDTTFDDNGNQDWIARQTDEDGHYHPLTGKVL